LKPDKFWLTVFVSDRIELMLGAFHWFDPGRLTVVAFHRPSPVIVDVGPVWVIFSHKVEIGPLILYVPNVPPVGVKLNVKSKKPFANRASFVARLPSEFAWLRYS